MGGTILLNLGGCQNVGTPSPTRQMAYKNNSSFLDNCRLFLGKNGSSLCFMLYLPCIWFLVTRFMLRARSTPLLFALLIHTTIPHRGGHCYRALSSYFFARSRFLLHLYQQHYYRVIFQLRIHTNYIHTQSYRFRH